MCRADGLTSSVQNTDKIKNAKAIIYGSTFDRVCSGHVTEHTHSALINELVSHVGSFLIRMYKMPRE